MSDYFDDGDSCIGIEAYIVKVTDNAALVSFEGEEEWIPISTIFDGSVPIEDAEGLDIELSIATWKMRDVGWA